MEQTPPTKEKLDATSEDAVVIPVDDASADDLDAPLTPKRIKQLLEGLSSEKAQQRLERYGPNSIPEREVKWYEVLRRQFTSSMALMIEAAAILAAALQEWAEFGCIAALLAINACIGFFEEWTAIQKVAAIRSKLAPTCAVKRDGKFERRPAAELVRGDLILLRGGDAVPADVDVIDGDTLQLDTAALTGEPFPRACPSSSGDRRALAGCVVVKGHAYAVVRLTGASTTHGEATLLVSSSTKPTVSVLEKSIVEACEKVMTVAIILLIGVGISLALRGKNTAETLDACLAILIAAVPVALPVVMQVTLALGASEMAKQEAIVTHLPALQEIASMTVLCSDKTGTLTTAKITVVKEEIWCNGVDRDTVLEWACVASNADADDDPIDVSVLKAFDGELSAYTDRTFVGADPVVKRAVADVTHEGRELRLCKGLVAKLLDAHGDGGVEFDVDCDRDAVRQADAELASRGFKTLGVVGGPRNGPLKFAGILPMLDPPRTDSKDVIDKLHACGVQVKMITGDDERVAAETSRRIGLGDTIATTDDLRAAADDDAFASLVQESDGFARVLPADKHAVVKTLQAKGEVVGMTGPRAGVNLSPSTRVAACQRERGRVDGVETPRYHAGDGVNDAPALRQAHVGIAVEGSADAARNAADVVLTRDGLGPIVTAVAESRKIFQRVYSYVLYRVSATIQIVAVLSILAFAWNEVIRPLYIIVLALLNDVTMIAVAYDHVIPSRAPERPTIAKLLRASGVFGFLMTVQSIIFYVLGSYTAVLGHRFHNSQAYRESMLYLQIALAIEGLIFSTRCPEAPFYSRAPAYSLVIAVIVADAAVTAIVVSGALGRDVSWEDVARVWFYDLIWFVLTDLCKIPLTMSIENCFPPVPVTEAPVPDGTDHVLAFGCVDLGYAYVRDTKENVRRRSRRSSVDVEAPSGAAAEGVV